MPNPISNYQPEWNIVNQFIYYNARIAPATPGLLNIVIYSKLQCNALVMNICYLSNSKYWALPLILLTHLTAGTKAGSRRAGGIRGAGASRG